MMNHTIMTREESLLAQIASLQFQLAQMAEQWARAEAEGPMAAKVRRDGEATVKHLRDLLAVRGMTLNEHGQAVSIVETGEVVPECPK